MALFFTYVVHPLTASAISSFLPYAAYPVAPPPAAPTVLPPTVPTHKPAVPPTIAQTGIDNPNVKTAGTTPTAAPTMPPVDKPTAPPPTPPTAPPPTADTAVTFVRGSF